MNSQDPWHRYISTSGQGRLKYQYGTDEEHTEMKDTKVTSKIKAKLLETQYRFILEEETNMAICRSSNGFTFSCPWCKHPKAWLFPNANHVLVFHCENNKCKHQSGNLSQVFGKHSRQVQREYNEAMSEVRQGFAQHGVLE